MIIEKNRRPIFHSVTVLAVSLAGAGSYAIWIAWRFSGATLFGQYIYVVPIIVPFIAFLLDRFELVLLLRRRTPFTPGNDPGHDLHSRCATVPIVSQQPTNSYFSPIQLCVDTLVVGTALMRVFSHVPFVSGHTLFLSYAMLSSRSRVARISAAIVLAETIYLKYVVWHDFVTSTIGVALGSLAAILVGRYRRERAGLDRVARRVGN